MICDERGPWIGTATGGRFYLKDPRADEMDIESMSIAISKVCRFGGHLSPAFIHDIYSVAQHSVYVWILVKHLWGEEDAAKWALLHDLLESAYGDNTSPMKVAVPGLKAIEGNAQPVLMEAFGIPYDARIAAIVHRADLTVGYREAEILQGSADGWNIGFDPLETMDDIDPMFTCWDPAMAYEMFSRAFRDEFGGEST